MIVDEIDSVQKIENEILKHKANSPQKAIVNFCISCMGYHKAYVKECTALNCPLYDFRLGKNPYRKSREYTEEEKEKLKERARKARESKNS